MKSRKWVPCSSSAHPEHIANLNSAVVACIYNMRCTIDAFAIRINRASGKPTIRYTQQISRLADHG